MLIDVQFGKVELEKDSEDGFWFLQKCVAWSINLPFGHGFYHKNLRFQNDFLTNWSLAGQFQVWPIWDSCQWNHMLLGSHWSPIHVLHICIILNIVKDKELYSKIFFKYGKFLFLGYFNFDSFSWMGFYLFYFLHMRPYVLGKFLA